MDVSERVNCLQGWDVHHEHDIADAHVTLQKARNAGIVVHPWP
jgi:hypothetical protein